MTTANRVGVEALAQRFPGYSSGAEEYQPHLSLVYGVYPDPMTLSQAKVRVQEALDKSKELGGAAGGLNAAEGVPLTHLKLVMTTGEAYWCWQVRFESLLLPFGHFPPHL